MIKVVAQLDCLLSLSKSSAALGEPCVRPEVVEAETAFADFEELRHPCIFRYVSLWPSRAHSPTLTLRPFAQRLDRLYSQRRCDRRRGKEPDPADWTQRAYHALRKRRRCLLCPHLSTPQMAGKSTLLRMTCTAVIMAQRKFLPKPCAFARRMTSVVRSRLLRARYEGPHLAHRCDLFPHGRERLHLCERIDFQGRDGRLQQDSAEGPSLSSCNFLCAALTLRMAAVDASFLGHSRRAGPRHLDIRRNGDCLRSSAPLGDSHGLHRILCHALHVADRGLCRKCRNALTLKDHSS